MKSSRVCRLVLALSLAALSFGASALTKTYNFTLDGAQEAPPNTSFAAGSASVTIDDSLGLISFYTAVMGLAHTDFTAAHIHMAPAGLSGGVVVPLHPIADFMGPVSLGPVVVPTSFGMTGEGKPIGTGLAAAINASPFDFYLNIHTTAYPGGEVRGQLALAPVPEPAGFAMLMAGLGLVGVAIRRRAKS